MNKKKDLSISKKERKKRIKKSRRKGRVRNMYMYTHQFSRVRKIYALGREKAEDERLVKGRERERERKAGFECGRDQIVIHNTLDRCIIYLN